MYGKLKYLCRCAREEFSAARPALSLLVILLSLATLPNLVGVLTPYPTWLGLKLFLFGLALPLALMVLGLPARAVLWGLSPLVLVGPGAAAVLWGTGCMPSTFLMLALLETNLQELSVFRFQALLVGVATLSILTLYVWLLRRGIPAGFRLPGVARAVLALAIAAPVMADLVAGGLDSSRAKLVQRLMTTYPTSTLAALAEAWDFRVEYAGRADLADRLEVEVSDEAKDAGRQLHLLVIGESARKKSFSLYGYERETTPMLDRTPGLLVFRDVVATAPITLAAVPQMLTPTRPGAIREATQLPSVLTAYRAAGFRVYWLSAQGKHGTFDTLTSTFSEDAHESAFLGGKFDVAGTGAYRGALDMDLLPSVKNILRRGEEKVLILLHTMGSHGPYPARYPSELNRFSVDPDEATQALVRMSTKVAMSGEEVQKVVDAYDNSIFATDCLLANLIHLVKAQNCTSWVCYVADHGENGADAGAMRFLHGVMTPDVLEIPMLMWLSPEYGQRFQDKTASLSSRLDQPLSAFTIFHTLVDMGGLSLDCLDLKSSLASTHFTPGERPTCGVGGLPVDYDREIGGLNRRPGGWQPLKPRSLKTAAVTGAVGTH